MINLIRKSEDHIEAFGWLKDFKDMWRTGIEIESELGDMADGKPICSQPYCVSNQCKKLNTCKDFPGYCHNCENKDFSCANCVHRTTSKATQYERIKSVLYPSGLETSFGKNGVFGVVDDHSLRRGIEVTTVGIKTANIEIQFNVLDKICKTLLKENAYTDYTCSVHYHLLHAVAKTAKDRPPGFILSNRYPDNFVKNVVNIFAYFAPAILYLASSGNKEKAITRYNCFRKIAYIPDAYSYKLNDYIGMYNSQLTSNGKYGLVNILNTTNYYNNLFPHFEIRANDGLLSPSLLTLYGIIYNALVYKALILSYDGLYDNSLEIVKRISFSNKIMNIGDGCRESINNLSKEDLTNINNICNEMMEFIDKELDFLCSFNSKVIKEKLNELISNPIYKLRINDYSWDKIEEIFSIRKEIENNFIARSIISMWPMKGAMSLSKFIDFVVDKIGCTHKNKNCKGRCDLTKKIAKAFILNNIDMIKAYARSYMI